MGADAGTPPSPESRSPGGTGQSGEPATGGTPPVRASDDERFRTAEVLGEHAAAGRLTLAELEDRVGRAYAATTRNELDALLRDLPATTPEHEQTLATRGASAPVGEDGTPESAATARRQRQRHSGGTRWFFTIMGGSAWRGRRRLKGTVNVVTVMGGDDIDLREAEIEGDELVINLISVMGGPSVYVPDTVDVEMSGPAILGGNDERGSTRPSRAGAPMIRIRAFSLMGGIDLWRLPAETRGMRLKDAKRAAKDIERNGEE